MLQAIDWTVSPILIEILGREIRWYGLLFALGFWVGYSVEEKMFEKEKVDKKILEKMFFYVFIATLVGARLGHCLFYDPGHYLANPIEIFKIWEGGLASHGGAIGILIGMYFFQKNVSHRSYLWGIDRLVVPVALVGALIRIGNLFNHEIYGHATDYPWGFRFIENINRVIALGETPIMTTASHPTQIYEALCYLITFGILIYLYFKREAYRREGLIFGIFLLGIFGSRFFIEFVKNSQEAFEETMALNMGQLLSLPFMIAGAYLLINALCRKQKSA